MRDEPSRARGKLKVFLGYAPGLGKTYAMLEAARERQAEGLDVVAGCVETHGRPETESLLAALPIVPPRVSVHRDGVDLELDLDALLARRPQLALIDALAHANFSAARHRRRYNDVEELLDAGIDVYTTLNIQHLASVNDVVAQITGMTVRDTVPDRLLDEADGIEVIDLPAPELLRRLDEGRVHLPDPASHAARSFYRLGNLNALRELTLRWVAGRVDDQMRDYMHARAIPGPWPAGDRLLVCIGPGTAGDRLVRTTRRLAQRLNAEWFAIHVETPACTRLSSAQRDRVAHALQLAEELDARSITIPGPSVPATVIEYARDHNITRIIAGKPRRPRWLELVRGSITEELMRDSGDIDVFLISSREETDRPEPAEGSPAVAAREDGTRRQIGAYAAATALVIVATLLGVPLHWHVSPTNLVMIYLAAVVVCALYLGRGQAVLAALLGVLALDFFFIPPRLTLTVEDTEYLVTFVGLLVVGFVVSSLTVQVREQAEAAQRSELEAVSLYEFSRDLAAAGELDGILRVVIRHVREIFGRGAAVLLLEGDVLCSAGSGSEPELDPGDLEAAEWAARQGRPAGYGTDTLPDAQARYLPLRTSQGVVGVLGVRPAGEPGHYLSIEQRRLLEVFANQAALAIERVRLGDQAQQAQLLQETEKLQAALLNSISHELRTPLVSITGTLTALEEDSAAESGLPALDSASRASLLSVAREEAQRLNRLVGNLLDMTRLEAHAMKVSAVPVDVAEMTGAALDRLAERLAERPLTIDIPRDLPLVPMDFRLLVQVLVNLLDNAVKYSPPGSPILIAAVEKGDWLELQVADRGPGVLPEDLDRIFDKFHRLQGADGAKGLGLGLSICRGIVEAHGGWIRANSRAGGGLAVVAGLPLAAPPPAAPSANKASEPYREASA